MPGVILAVLDDPAAMSPLLGAAARLADLIGGALVHALIVRAPPHAAILHGEEILTAQQADSIRAQEQARAAALTQVFLDWQRDTGRAADLSNVEGVAADIVATRGAVADFLVIGHSARRPYGTGRDAIHAALFDTDRPALVVPAAAGDGFGRRVALAWRDDSRTIRAVLAALRCFTQLDHLVVLAGRKEGAPPPRLPDILVEHGIAAELRILPVAPHPFGKTLLAAAHACGADLLVMGAFGHDPVRRLILGGVTDYMLAHADLPVLMRH
jgi:nucleotide-binding universal stress UspA family protein